MIFTSHHRTELELPGVCKRGAPKQTMIAEHAMVILTNGFAPTRHCLSPNVVGSILKHILGRPTSIFKRLSCRMFECIGSLNPSLVQMKPNEASITLGTGNRGDLIIMAWKKWDLNVIWFAKARAALQIEIDRKTLLFTTYDFPEPPLRISLHWKRKWRRASNRLQRLRKTLVGSSLCPPQPLRSSRTSPLSKASEPKTQTRPISLQESLDAVQSHLRKGDCYKKVPYFWRVQEPGIRYSSTNQHCFWRHVDVGPYCFLHFSAVLVVGWVGWGG